MDSLVRSFGVAFLAIAVGVLIAVQTVRESASSELGSALVLCVIVEAAAVWFAVDRWRLGNRLRAAATSGEERFANLVGIEKTRARRAEAHMNLESRTYELNIDGEIVRYAAVSAGMRPLFLDEDHTQALLMRAPDGKFIVVRADFWPFALTPAEERAARERIEALRETRR
jgi:hypothetical protein